MKYWQEILIYAYGIAIGVWGGWILWGIK